MRGGRGGGVLLGQTNLYSQSLRHEKIRRRAKKHPCEGTVYKDTFSEISAKNMSRGDEQEEKVRVKEAINFGGVSASKARLV